MRISSPYALHYYGNDLHDSQVILWAYTPARLSKGVLRTGECEVDSQASHSRSAMPSDPLCSRSFAALFVAEPREDMYVTQHS
jgi:hypothetical protein